MADTKAAIQTYKKLRKLIRDGKVIHLIAPRTNVEHYGRGWDAIQSVSVDQTDSVVMVFRARGGPDEQRVQLRGLQPDAQYKVTLADAGGETIHTGAELHREGILISLPEDTSEFIELSWL
jgi:alpha-galactosidase